MVIFSYPLHAMPHWGVPVGLLLYRLLWKNKIGLATRRGKNCDGFAILTEYRWVTDRQRDILPRHGPIVRTMHTRLS